MPSVIIGKRPFNHFQKSSVGLLIALQVPVKIDKKAKSRVAIEPWSIGHKRSHLLRYLDTTLATTRELFPAHRVIIHKKNVSFIKIRKLWLTKGRVLNYRIMRLKKNTHKTALCVTWHARGEKYSNAAKKTQWLTHYNLHELPKISPIFLCSKFKITVCLKPFLILQLIWQ